MQIQTNGNGQKQSGRSARELDYAPAPVDVYENEQEILVVVDMPGVAAAGVDVSLDGSELTIEGRREGRSPARLRRTFTVPRSVDPDRIGATMDAGVLTVRLGKRDEVKPRRIAVESVD